MIADSYPSYPPSQILFKYLGHPSHEAPSTTFLLGTFLTVLGGWIRFRCYKELGAMFTFEMSILKVHKLVMSGPYSVVRHPGYAGVLCTVLGIVICHGSSASSLYQLSISGS